MLVANIWKNWRGWQRTFPDPLKRIEQLAQPNTDNSILLKPKILAKKNKTGKKLTSSAPSGSKKTSPTSGNLGEKPSSSAGDASLGQCSMSALAGTPKSVATIEIAPHGDIILELPSATGIAKLKVASQVLCSASPVFRAMLGPNSSFKEACELRTRSTNTEPYRLQLEDDNPEALAVILLALHCQNFLVPKNISFKNLLDLAIICDKYDCAAGVSLWIDIWTQKWKAMTLVAGYEQWLFIAWTFGMGEVFESLSKKLILEGLYSAEDPTLFVTKEGFCLDEMLVPEHIMEAIRERRRIAIHSMSEATLHYQELYTKPWGASICKAAVKSEVCDATIIGSIVKGFRSLGLVPDFDKFLLKSVKDMEKSVKDLRIEFMSATKPKYTYSCSGCGRAGTTSGNAYCNSCCYTRSFTMNTTTEATTHKETCSFLPELHKKISTAVEGVKGLILDNFRGPRGKSATVSVGKWDLFEYK